jgi:hypothetical protein
MIFFIAHPVGQCCDISLALDARIAVHRAQTVDGMMHIESLRIWRGNCCTLAGLLVNI